MIVYVDTSAAMKLLVEEKESAELADHLQHRIESGDTLVASLLLHAELHCAANRRPEDIRHEAVSDVLSTIALVDIESGDLITAPLLPGRLRSADALHLAAAVRLLGVPVLRHLLLDAVEERREAPLLRVQQIGRAHV